MNVIHLSLYPRQQPDLPLEEERMDAHVGEYYYHQNPGREPWIHWLKQLKVERL